jgi:predicted nuclease with TOPRIM domain
MNNTQELIERLDAIKALVPEIGVANCEAPIDDAITALDSMQAPLPEDVQEMATALRGGYVCDILVKCHRAADMLEKLWRENEEYARRDIVLSDDNTELQHRIEELEEENKRLDAAFRKIEQAMLPDPYDERDISFNWLRKTIHKIIEKARAGE